MDKFKQFYAQSVADDTIGAEVKKILGKTPIEDATDDQLIKLGELAKTLGLDIALDEAKAYLAKSADDEDEGEISADELQAVAGGDKSGDCDPHRAPHLNKHILNQ